MGKWRDSSLSGLDAQRALLDELMGGNRNLDNPDADVTDFKDERVCKNFLLGLCPCDLFSKTKVDYGHCDKAHDDKLKEDYVKYKAEGGRDLGYERELERALKEIVTEIDKKIQRGHKRLEGEGGAAKNFPDIDNNPEVLKLQSEISEAMAKAEEAGEQGEVDTAQELMEQVEGLQGKLAEVLAGIRAKVMGEEASRGGPMPDVNQKLRVCEVCGAFLSISDNDKRLADHFGGKLHLGYVQVRDKLKEIQEALYGGKAGDSRGDNHRSERDNRGGGRDRSRERGGGGGGGDVGKYGRADSGGGDSRYGRGGGADYYRREGGGSRGGGDRGGGGGDRYRPRDDRRRSRSRSRDSR